jgi:hypothetical protein
MRIKQVEDLLVNPIKEKGLKVTYVQIKASGGNGEYYVYTGKVNNKKIVFSNNSKIHQQENAVIGRNIDKKNAQEILDKILA